MFQDGIDDPAAALALGCHLGLIHYRYDIASDDGSDVTEPPLDNIFDSDDDRFRKGHSSLLYAERACA